MTSHKKIIESLRRKRFGIGLNLDNLPDDILDHIEEAEKFRRNATKLVEEIHTNKTNFILELIQNAEDNEYKKDEEPTLKILHYPDELVIQNNEKGFNKANVNALCNIGETTKGDKTYGYIGEKGIGFKSVFKVSNFPQIFSNGFQFGFDYVQSNPTSIIIPKWIDKIPYRVNPKLTNILLPLEGEIKEDFSILKELQPTLLLFLKKLKQIKIKHIDTKELIILQKKSRKNVVILESNEKKEFWYKIKSDKLSVPKEIEEQRREDIKETEMTLAFPLKDNLQSNTEDTRPLFAFLPVRDYGFRFIIQGDFILDVGRLEILQTKDWNKVLRDNVSDLFMKAADNFKNERILKYDYYDYIPLLEDIKEDYFETIVNEIHEKLKESNCILSESNNWLKPEEILEADPTTKEVFSNKIIKELLGKEYIHPKVKINSGIAKVLGIEKFKFFHIVKILESKEFLSNQSDNWMSKLYTYLISKDYRHNRLIEISKHDMIRLEDDSLTSPYSMLIFLPGELLGSYGFERNLRMMKKTIFDAVLRSSDENYTESAIEFFKDLDLRETHSNELIENYILNCYDKDEDDPESWKHLDESILIGHIRYIKDVFIKSREESTNLMDTNLFIKIEKNLLIRIKKTFEGTNYYDKMENTYLSSDYTKDQKLDALFNDDDDAINQFIHNIYLISSLKQKKKRFSEKILSRKKAEPAYIVKEREEWREFFIQFGSHECPRVIGKTKKYRSSKRKYYDYTDYELSDELSNLIESGENEKLRILFSLFNEYWDDYYKKYREINHPSSYDNQPSSFLNSLRKSKWIISNNGELHSPKDLFLDQRQIKEIFGASVRYLDQKFTNIEFATDIGINLSVTVNNVLKQLRKYSEEKENNKTKLLHLYNFLDSNYKGNEDDITDFFASEEGIYVPKTMKMYYKSSDVFWTPGIRLVRFPQDSLSKHYPKLKRFFVNKVEVNLNPSAHQFSVLLESIIPRAKEKELTEREEKTIIKIYEALDTYLRKKDEQNIENEEWWSNFLRKYIFWTHRKEFWRNDEDIFVSDDSLIFDLFKDIKRIAFLNIDYNVYPKISSFLQSANIPLASEVLDVKLDSNKEMIQDERLTEFLRLYHEYILRYLYRIEYRNYNRLKENGRLDDLDNITVYVVKNLTVKYELFNEVQIHSKEIIFEGTNLIIQETHVLDLDIIAGEINKFCGNLKGFDDFLSALFAKKTSEDVEAYLERKKIPELPQEEFLWFETGGSIYEDEEWYEEETPFYGTSEIKDLNEDLQSHLPENEVTIQDRTENSFPARKSAKKHYRKKKQRRSLKPSKEWIPEVKPEEAQIILDEYHFEGDIVDYKEILTKDSKISYSTIKNEYAPPKIPVTQSSSQYDRIKKPSGEINEILFDDVIQFQDSDMNKKIGDWGERYVLRVLKEQFKKKYPRFTFKQTEEGFLVSKGKKVYVNVKWLNLDFDAPGRDIELVEEGIKYYIEIKTTKTERLRKFKLSRFQWELMMQLGENYHIYRVFSAGTEKARILKLDNPAKLIIEGKIRVDSAEIRI